MKKKNKDKKKFEDFDPKEYAKKQNNISSSKQNKSVKNSIDNKKSKLSFQNSIENLIFNFPNFSRELIEDLYLENDENFSKTKDKLKEVSETENNENKINENDMQIEEEEQNIPKKKNTKKKKKFADISEFSNFEIVDKNDPIGLDEDDEVHYISDDEEKKDISNDQKNNNEYNKLLSIKEKGWKEYSSIFEQGKMIAI